VRNRTENTAQFRYHSRMRALLALVLVLSLAAPAFAVQAVGNGSVPIPVPATLGGTGQSSFVTNCLVAATSSTALGCTSAPTVSGANLGTATIPNAALVTTPPVQTCTTWTPTDQSGAALSLTVTSANYCKTGRIVTFQMDIVYPSNASGVANAVSLPIVPLAVNQGSMVTTSSLALTMEVLITGGNQIFVQKASSGAEANATLSTGTFRVQGTYISAS
jgi:hypothetical protein